MRFMDGSTLFLNWSFGNFFLPPSHEGAKPNLIFRNFKVVFVERRDSSLYIEKVAEGLIYIVLLFSLQWDGVRVEGVFPRESHG